MLINKIGYNILGEKKWGDNYGTETVQKLRKHSGNMSRAI